VNNESFKKNDLVRLNKTSLKGLQESIKGFVVAGVARKSTKKNAWVAQWKMISGLGARYPFSWGESQ